MKLLFAEGEKFALLAHGTAAEAGVFGLACCCSRPLLRVAVLPRQCPRPPLERCFGIAMEMLSHQVSGLGSLFVRCLLQPFEEARIARLNILL